MTNYQLHAQEASLSGYFIVISYRNKHLDELFTHKILIPVNNLNHNSVDSLFTAIKSTPRTLISLFDNSKQIHLDYCTVQSLQRLHFKDSGLINYKTVKE